MYVIALIVYVVRDVVHSHVNAAQDAYVVLADAADIVAPIPAFAAQYVIAPPVVAVVSVDPIHAGVVQFVIVVLAHVVLKLLLAIQLPLYAIRRADLHVEAHVGLLELLVDLLAIRLVNLFVGHLVFHLAKSLAFLLELLVIQLCTLIIK